VITLKVSIGQFSELKRRIRQFNVCFPNENLGSHPLLGGYRNLRFLFRAVDSIVGGLKLTVSFIVTVQKFFKNCEEANQP